MLPAREETEFTDPEDDPDVGEKLTTPIINRMNTGRLHCQAESRQSFICQFSITNKMKQDLDFNSPAR